MHRAARGRRAACSQALLRWHCCGEQVYLFRCSTGSVALACSRRVPHWAVATEGAQPKVLAGKRDVHVEVQLVHCSRRQGINSIAASGAPAAIASAHGPADQAFTRARLLFGIAPASWAPALVCRRGRTGKLVWRSSALCTATCGQKCDDSLLLVPAQKVGQGVGQLATSSTQLPLEQVYWQFWSQVLDVPVQPLPAQHCSWLPHVLLHLRQTKEQAAGFGSRSVVATNGSACLIRASS